MVRASRERSESRRASQQNLRKTNSEPNVDMPSIDVEALQKLLLSLPKFASASRSRVNHRHDSDSGGEMTTEIEELKDAAKSIQSLQRVLAYPSQVSSDRGGNRRLPPVDPVESCLESSVFSDVDESSLATDTTDTRRSGISTRLGHPRGVMQFIPSIRNDQFVPTSEIRRNSISRKSSVPDGFMANELQSDPVPNVRNRRRGIVDEMFSSSTSLLVDRPSETLAGVNRFAKLLDTFRSRPTSPEQHPSISWNPYVYSDGGEALETCGMEDSLHEADILLWKKRSRASLRRHYSVRHLAARELLDTEKSFVEGLEFLVTKYMRPLRQPLECTLIEASLVDKIFYRIPEILAHHQVLLTTLSQRIEQWHKEAILGDVLLAHFSKQSMIETYIAFVDNFKFAKAAITQARQKHAFEKYYSRCSRDHPNKLDLDALLISPIQRVPRYELIVKQMLKHTPVEHEDRERLQRAQRHIHCLAVAINQHKDGSEQMEQRLREIEAIVDGLEDLVTKERTLLRHDIITLKGTDRERCIFMLSDLLLVTSVRKKPKAIYNKMTSQSMGFLESNRFKLLFKVSLEDVQISKDTLSQLEEVERKLESSREDDRVLKKMSQLCCLLKCEKKTLIEMLETMETDNSMSIRKLTDKMSSDPDLSAVNLDVLTSNGFEPFVLEFPNAEKRSVWEATFKDAKITQSKHLTAAPSFSLKTIIAHQTRPGLQLCTATVVPGKRVDSTPSLWVCASDKFSGQVAVMSLDTGEITIESCSAIGNAAVTAMCTVPPPTKPRKRKIKSQKSLEQMQNETIMDINSSGSDSESSSDEGTSTAGQTTVWIGNDDGEVFVVNSTERIRSRTRDRLARLRNSVTSICAANGNVLVATSYSNQVQLLLFRPGSDGGWDLDNPQTVGHVCQAPITNMQQIGKRVIIASGNSLHSFFMDTGKFQPPIEVLPSSDVITLMNVTGQYVFLCGRKSTEVFVIDAFELSILNHFNVSSFVRSQLSGREHILREHKMGCLRVSCLTVARHSLWIGTSAGFVLSTSIQSAKSNPTPDLRVCEIGHSGPCRILLPIQSPSSHSNHPSRKQKRTSLNVPAQQSSQLMLVSCGEGLDDGTATQDPSTDAINHLIFWKCL